MANYISISSASIVVGSQSVITIDSPSAEYGYFPDISGHTITVQCSTHGSNVSYTTEYDSTNNKYKCKFTITGAMIPNATTATITVTIPVFTVLYSKAKPSERIAGRFVHNETFTYKATVPDTSTFRPGASTFTTTRVNNGMNSSAFNSFGVYVQGYTKVQITLSGITAGSGSSVKQVRITTSPNCGSYSQNNGNDISWTSNALSSSGTDTTYTTYTITRTVTDNRNRTTTATKTITVYSYGPPTISSLAAIRCNSSGTANAISGTYAKITPTYNYSPVAVSGTNKNSLSVVKIEIKDGNTVVASKDSGITSGSSYTLGGGNIATNKSYSVIFTLTDAVGNTTTRTVIVPSAVFMLHFKKNGKSVGIGRVAGDDNTLNVGWNTKVDSDKYIALSGQYGYYEIKNTVNNVDYGLRMIFATSGADAGKKRGLWDITNSDWMIYTDTENKIKIPRTLEVANSVSCTSLSSTGNISSTGSVSGAKVIIDEPSEDNTPIWFRHNGTPIGTIYANYPNKKLYFVSFPSDYNSSTHAYTEQYRMPTANTGLSATTSYDILTTKGDNTMLGDLSFGTSGASSASSRVTWTTADSTIFKLRTYSNLLQFVRQPSGDTDKNVIGMVSDGTVYISGTTAINSGVLQLRSANNNYIRAFRSTFDPNSSSSNVSGTIIMSNSGQTLFYEYPTDNTTSSSTNREYYYLPTPDTGRSSAAGFRIHTNKTLNVDNIGSFKSILVENGKTIIYGTRILVVYANTSSIGGLVVCYFTSSNASAVNTIVSKGTSQLTFNAMYKSGEPEGKQHMLEINNTGSNVYRVWYISDNTNL